MKKPMVKLNDGTQVPLETFITWSPRKQNAKTRSLEELKKLFDKLSETHKRVVNTPLGRFNSVKEAAERHKFDIAKLRKLLQNTAISDFNYDKPRANDTRQQFHAPPEKIVTPLGKFITRKAAAKAHGFSTTQLNNFIRNNSENYYLIKDGPKPNPQKIPNPEWALLSPDAYKEAIEKRSEARRREVITPYGKFITKTAAAKAHGFSSKRLNTSLRNNSENYYLIKDGPKPNPQKIPNPQWFRLPPDAYKEGREKRAEALRREVITPYGNFATSSIAAEYLGVAIETFRRLIHNTAHPEYTYANPKFIIQSKLHHKPNIKVPKLTITPLGTYKFKRGPQKAPDITSGELEILKENKPEDFHLTEDVSNLKLFHGNKIARQSTVNFQPKRGVVTPKGHFPSKIQAALAHNKSSKEFKKYLIPSQISIILLKRLKRLK